MDRLTFEIAPSLRQGSRDAWKRLYEEYADRLYHEVARLLGGENADVDDVVQEVFFEAARSASKFDARRGSLWMWLTGIAKHCVVKQFHQRTAHLERARRWWQSLDGSAQQWLAGVDDIPSTVAESKELAELVRAALLALSDEYRVLLTRRYLDGVSAEEIANEVACSANAVRARLVRARRKFRQNFSRLAGVGQTSGEM